MQKDNLGRHIWVKGIVQGVGFRPFIYSLAHRFYLTGWVRNTSGGVEIEVFGPQTNLDQFIASVKSEYPPLARIDQLDITPSNNPPKAAFEILTSQPEAGEFMPVSPDVCMCADCRQELLDPANRRYRYPLINCTNCGPRFSIIQDIPYDRPNTTMAPFKMCADCQAEYDNPLDRRFHAQPTACPVCGPQLSFYAGDVKIAEKDAALNLARAWLAEGKIIAVKGLGGYLLVCDAHNAATLSELRRRKQRSDKAFALMAYDLATIERYCQVTPPDRQCLSDHTSPIVLMDKKTGGLLPEMIAPHQKTLGFMLPYTPLHWLLLEPGSGFPDVLVMTSGNLSEEPIAFQDQDAFDRLAGIADGFLIHDRPIHMRLDNSVLRLVNQRPYLLRRARGFAPGSIELPAAGPSILATGAELKNTFCLTRDRYAFLSHHIGDLENYETLASFEQGIEHYQRLFRIQPERIACDLHPDYLATRYALQKAAALNIPCIQVQHHHAHLAACLADNGYDSPEPVIGLCYDGTGLGTDQAVWGGEVILGGYQGYQRIYHLSYTPLPGGDAVARKPTRMALAHLWQAGMDWDIQYPPTLALCPEDRTILRTQLERRLNTPLSSSMGRLFDAAASLIGVCQTSTYEGQAAIEMEAICDLHETGYYEFEITANTFNPAPLWLALTDDWRKGTPQPILAARFHNSVAQISLKLCEVTRKSFQTQRVALSGGVWQNHFLLTRTLALLEKAGFTTLWHRQVPANDGGIALGQALVAARMQV